MSPNVIRITTFVRHALFLACIHMRTEDLSISNRVVLIVQFKSIFTKNSSWFNNFTFVVRERTALKSRSQLPFQNKVDEEENHKKSKRLFLEKVALVGFPNVKTSKRTPD